MSTKNLQKINKGLSKYQFVRMSSVLLSTLNQQNINTFSTGNG